MNTKTKYYIVITAFVVLAYLAIRFYIDTAIHGISITDKSLYVYYGFFIFVAIGITSVLLYYYRTVRNKRSLENMRLDDELQAYSYIAEENTKAIIAKLLGTSEEVIKLTKEEFLHVDLRRFGVPIRAGDQVIFMTDVNNKDTFIRCKIKQINKDNNLVEIVLSNKN